MNEGRHIPVLMTLLAAILWASSFSVIKVGLRYIDPYTFLLLRFLIAAALMSVVVCFAGKSRLLAAHMSHKYSAALGLALAASFTLQFRAQTEIPASTAAIIINSSTLLVAPLSAMFLSERIGARKIAALVLGIVGVYLITGRSVRAEGGGTWLGNALISASAVSTAFYIVLTKRALSEKKLDGLPLLTAVFAWSLPVYLVMSLPELKNGLRAGREAWMAIIYLSIFCSALAFLLWATAIKRIGALTSAVVLLSELVFGVLIAHLLLEEVISIPAVAGCALIGLGILIVGLRE